MLAKNYTYKYIQSMIFQILIKYQQKKNIIDVFFFASIFSRLFWKYSQNFRCCFVIEIFSFLEYFLCIWKE